MFLKLFIDLFDNSILDVIQKGKVIAIQFMEERFYRIFNSSTKGVGRGWNISGSLRKIATPPPPSGYDYMQKMGVPGKGFIFCSHIGGNAKL